MELPKRLGWPGRSEHGFWLCEEDEGLGLAEDLEQRFSQRPNEKS